MNKFHTLIRLGITFIVGILLTIITLGAWESDSTKDKKGASRKDGKK